MVRLEIEENINKDELADLVRGFRFSSFFSSADWVGLLSSSFRSFSSFWITARHDSRLEGAMPAIKVRKNIFFYLRSLPFATYGNPLAHRPEVRSLMIRKFLELSARMNCLNASAVIFDPDWSDWIPPDIPAEPAESRIIELREDFDYYRTRSMSSTKRKVCRRSRRAGVTVRALSTERELNDFYRIYRERSSGWGGVHPFPLKFFRNLFEHSGTDLGFSGAFLDGRLLGCHIDFYGGNMAQAWISGVSGEGNELGAPTLLIYNSVRKAYEKGMRYFNLGSSGGDRGLIFFKESLGGKRSDYLIVTSEKRWWKWIRKV
ncbi:MAG: GNAT family N-acetyltransferase [Candidatus Krumholzibacteriales bacterium]